MTRKQESNKNRLFAFKRFFSSLLKNFSSKEKEKKFKSKNIKIIILGRSEKNEKRMEKNKIIFFGFQFFQTVRKYTEKTYIIFGVFFCLIFLNLFDFFSLLLFYYIFSFFSLVCIEWYLCMRW